MEFRIGINNCRKQLAGIGRDHLCDFQNGVQYQFPYPVRGRQLESTSSGFAEEFSDGLVGLKPFHRAKYVVLHHGQREAGNLSAPASCQVCGPLRHEARNRGTTGSCHRSEAASDICNRGCSCAQGERIPCR